ncbi:MAG TPA: SCO family protein [Aquihabitans sp.]|jgi:protein SCO1/2|nr:SCO family protein [Aquihabitans sp.]
MPADPAPWSRRRFLTAGATVAAGLSVAGCSLSRGSTPDESRVEGTGETDWSGTLVEPPFPKPAVTFTDTDGEPFPFEERTEGRLTLLFFGYTNCPDVCPVYLNTLARAKEGIGGGPGSKPLVLFVGVDTARDTPEVMKTYLANIDPAFVGLTATNEVIAEAIKTVKGAPVVLGEPEPDGSYEVGHPAQVTVYTADGGGRRIYPYGVRQQDWVKDLPRLDRGEYK